MVRAHIWLVDSDVKVDVLCVVDITLPRSALSTFDLPVAGAALTLQDLPVRGILSLEHDDGRRSGFFLDFHITGEDYSRLGRDVLERTVMVYDPRGANLVFEVLDADI